MRQNIVFVFPKSDRQTRQKSRSERRRFNVFGAAHACVHYVGLELEHNIAYARASVDL